LGESSIRAFVAVDIESAEIKGKLVSAQDHLRQTGADLKLVEPENIHITMRFLGDISAPRVEEVKHALDAVEFAPFECEFVGMGAFPSMKRINVVWVGISAGSPELARISSTLEEGLRQIGFTPDNKGFNPHVTVARVKTGRNREMLASYIDQMRTYEFGKLPVNEVRLKRSILKPSGPVYTTIHSRSGTGR
jgi:2'-5' RNA ligase